jgi:hypothetical protein
VLSFPHYRFAQSKPGTKEALQELCRGSGWVIRITESDEQPSIIILSLARID